MRLQRIYRILHADRSVPVTDRFLGPRRRFLCVTGRTRIGNFELIRHRGRDKTERMRMHVRTGNAFGLYLRHMANHALASRTAHSMMCMPLHRRRVRAVGRCRTMAFQT
jgi:hypothetical protein